MLAFAPHQAFEMLDLGTGSGAILLAILAERPARRGVGTDISTEALAVARENAANLDLDGRATFLRTEWAAGLRRRTASTWWSPTRPTSRPSDIPGLDPEVRDHDPHLALDGGPDGLQAYRDLAPEIRAHPQARRRSSPSRSAGTRARRSRPCSRPPASRT